MLDVAPPVTLACRKVLGPPPMLAILSNRSPDFRSEAMAVVVALRYARGIICEGKRAREGDVELSFSAMQAFSYGRLNQGLVVPTSAAHRADTLPA